MIDMKTTRSIGHFVNTLHTLGVHMKYFLTAIIIFLLAGCAQPLSEENAKYVGLWKSNQTSLLITQAGRLEYESQKGNVSTSVSMPIKSIDSSGIQAGFLFFSSNFELQGIPKEEDGMLVLVVDGEKLYKTDELGRMPKSTKVPSLDKLQPLVTNQLSLLSKGIKEKDFTAYLEGTSMLYQSNFSAEKLLDIYKSFIENKIDIGEFMVGAFVLTKEPVIDENGFLVVSGKYQTSPNSLKFSLSYVYSHPNWKSVGANIYIDEE